MGKRIKLTIDNGNEVTDIKEIQENETLVSNNVTELIEILGLELEEFGFYCFLVKKYGKNKLLNFHIEGFDTFIKVIYNDYYNKKNIKEGLKERVIEEADIEFALTSFFYFINKVEDDLKLTDLEKERKIEKRINIIINKLIKLKLIVLDRKKKTKTIYSLWKI